MARRNNIAAITTDGVGAGGVGTEPDWISVWDSETGGNFIRSMPLSVAVAALALGERIELPAEALSIAKSPTNGTLISGLLITAGGSGYADASTSINFSGGGRGRDAAATAVITAGVITGAIITNPGYGYSSVPTISISSSGSGAGATATALLSGRETERSVLAALVGETSEDWWLQFHDGNPGAAGTQNVITDLARLRQESTNWRTA